VRLLRNTLYATAFAASLTLAIHPAAAATPTPLFPRSEPQASGEVHQAARSEPQASGEVHETWLGRYSTPTGCSGGPSSPLAQAASFGAAAATIAFLARRRQA
jgi:hypothetical protein